MNILQHIPQSTFSDVLVTLNPPRPPKSEHLKAIYYYSHPLYTTEAVRAQTHLDKIQGMRGIYYVGAWTGYGFHEDGFTSGVRVGVRLGGSVPFEVVDAKTIRGEGKVFGLKEKLMTFALLWVYLWLDVVATMLFVFRGFVSSPTRSWSRVMKED
jgi:hypothetical protein